MTKAKVDRRDPPTTRTAKCAVCGKARPELAVKHNDPFCSAACCREYYRLDAKPGDDE